MKKDKIVDSLSQVDFTCLKFPTIVIYNKPDDYPHCSYIARVFDIAIPTNIIIQREKLSECRDEIVKAGLSVNIGRHPADSKSVVESWI